MTRTSRCLHLIVLAAGAFVPDPVHAQAVSGRVLIATAWSSIRVDGVLERVDGFWPGAAVDVQMGSLTITASGTRGRLTSSIPFEPLERDAGEVSLSGRYALRSWLRFDVRYAGRVFSSPPGRQRWDMVGFGLAASRALGTPALRSFLGIAYLPLVNVEGTAGSHTGLASHMGIELESPRLPLTVALTYRVERFDFSSAADRSEQFEALTASIGIRLRRFDGRWTLVQ